MKDQFENGYFLIPSEILKHPLWKADKIFTKGHALIDLFGHAKYGIKDYYVNGRHINLKDNQVASSMADLGRKWGWSSGKVSKFLYQLENEGFIKQKRNNAVTIITILDNDYVQL
jgi:hypothetical protein